MRGYSRALSSILGLAVLPLLHGCSDPPGPEDERGGQIVDEGQMTVVIHRSAAELEVGQTIRLRAVLRAADGRVLDHNFHVKWIVSRPEFVSITDNGYATGIAPGYTRIMADSKLGSDWTYLTVRERGPSGSPGDAGDEKHEPEDDRDPPDP